MKIVASIDSNEANRIASRATKRPVRRVVLTRWAVVPAEVIYKYRGDVGRDAGTMDKDRMITSSDFGSALGVGRFKNRNQIFKDKFNAACCKVVEVPKRVKKHDWSKDILEHGIKTEEYALDILGQILKVNVEKSYTTYEVYTNGVHNFKLGSTPDGYVTLGNEKSVVEVKCPYISDSLLRKGEDAMDPDHWCQVQGQMAVTGLDTCYYAVYMSRTNQYSVKKVFKDQEFIQVMLYELYKLAMHVDQAATEVFSGRPYDQVLKEYKLRTSKVIQKEIQHYIEERQKTHVKSLYYTDKDSVIVVE